MSIPDLITGCIELAYSVIVWGNVWRIRRDRQVKGVIWQLWIFLTAWGVWNLYYYLHLGQVFAFIGGIVLVTGNFTWTCFAVHLWRLNRGPRIIAIDP